MSATYDEIRHQPDAWRQTVAAVREQWDGEIQPGTHFLNIGSGTSLYIAQSAAQVLQELTGHVASAVPSSEVFLSSSSVIPRGVPVVAFIISRSGSTSEAVLAAEYLRDHRPEVRVVGLTCAEDSDLQRVAGQAIVLPHAVESSVVMTQSFTSLLLALQVIAALVAGDAGFLDELERLPDALDRHFDRFEEMAQGIGEDRSLDQFIYLGLGPNYGLAQEANLKLKEMTQTPCEAYNPLEFRHGPISIVRPGTATVLLEGLRERSYIADLETDVKAHGARVIALTPHEASSADLAIAMPDEFSDPARCVLYMPPLQLVAYFRARTLGLDPDTPRNLTQVVVLGSH